MASEFQVPDTIKLLNGVAALRKMQNIGDKEIELLGLFLDERYRVRNTAVGKFQFYSHVCLHKPSNAWPQLMLEVDKALLHLESAGIIGETIVAGIQPRLGGASTAYTLSAEGVVYLQKLNPGLMLSLRNNASLAPPWVTGFVTLWAFFTILASILGAAAHLAGLFPGSLP